MRTYQVEKNEYGRYLVVRKEQGKADFIVSSEENEKRANDLKKLIEERIKKAC